MRILLFVAGGGGAGALLRYLVSGLGQRLTVGVFPLGTLLVNVLGCFLIGYLGAVFSGPLLVRDEVRLALLVGLLGGFTTFSSFGWETFSLLNDREWGFAIANVVGSNLLGLLAVWIGYRLAEQWPGV
ncbi:MAG: fluoride efflux transporter CrcB [Planctomycetota bacterium]